jgi:hypothetical protein
MGLSCLNAITSRWVGSMMLQRFPSRRSCYPGQLGHAHVVYCSSGQKSNRGAGPGGEAGCDANQLMVALSSLGLALGLA